MGSIAKFATKYGKYLEFYKDDIAINFHRVAAIDRIHKEKHTLEYNKFIPTRVIGQKLYFPPASAAKFLDCTQKNFFIKEENKRTALEIIRNHSNSNHLAYLASIADRHKGRGKNPDSDARSTLRFNCLKITSADNFGLLGLQTNSGKLKNNKQYGRLISICGEVQNKIIHAIENSDLVILPLDSYLGQMTMAEVFFAKAITVPVYAYWNCNNRDFVFNRFSWIISCCTRIFDSLDQFRRFTI